MISAFCIFLATVSLFLSFLALVAAGTLKGRIDKVEESNVRLAQVVLEITQEFKRFAEVQVEGLKILKSNNAQVQQHEESLRAIIPRVAQ
jgi:hypothetical protein